MSAASREEEQLKRALALSAAEERRRQSREEGSRHRAEQDGIHVGSRVTVAVTRPRNGWGPVSRGDVGIVTKFSGSLAHVSFGRKTKLLGKHGWSCAVTDLVVAPEPNDSLPDTSSDLAIALRLQEEEQRSGGRPSAGISSPSGKCSDSPRSMLRQDSTEVVGLYAQKVMDEKRAATTLDRIVASCVASDSLFLDSDFPCTAASLHGSSPESKDGHGNFSGAVAWRRGPQIGKTMRAIAGVQPRDKWVVFRSDTPSAEDLQQGGLGDCYFISALACIAQRPALVKSLFVGPSFDALRESQSGLSRWGVYQIRLCLDGYWKVITLDDMLPVNNDGAVAYAIGSRLQLWPALMEKAFAKAYGSYSSIVSGHCDECLSMLTGAPCDTFHLVQSEEEAKKLRSKGEGSWWNYDDVLICLESYHSAGFLMATSCTVRDGDSEERYAELGLQTRHAYSLLAIDIVTGTGNERIPMVKLRNPWGRGSWSGEFGPSSNAWTRDARNQLGYYVEGAGQDGGVFWMTLKDWFYHFTTIYVCRKRNDRASIWQEIRVRAPMRNVSICGSPTRASLPCFRVEVLDTTELECTLHQASDRGLARHGSLASIGFIIVREHSSRQGKDAVSRDARIEYVASSSIQSSTRVRCDAMLCTGTFLFIPIVFNCSSAPNNGDVHTPRHQIGDEAPRLIFAFHTPKPLLVTEIRIFPRTVARSLIRRVQREGEITINKGLVVRTLTDAGGCYITAQNSMPRGSAYISLDLSSSGNLAMSRGSAVTVDVIPAGKQMVVNCATALGGGWYFQSKIEMQTSSGETHSPGIFGNGLHDTIPMNL